jgi:pilus assembly protein CpaF
LFVELRGLFRTSLSEPEGADERMFAIVVNEKGGEQKRLEFDKPEVTIGRVQGNDIILPKGNVSKRHSRIVLKDG